MKTDPALTEKVTVEAVKVKTNEDLDRKALRYEAALAECNARLDDVRLSEEAALEEAKKIAADQPAAPWWRRMFGGGK